MEALLVTRPLGVIECKYAKTPWILSRPSQKDSNFAIFQITTVNDG
jgi:hypothetical protein